MPFAEPDDAFRPAWHDAVQGMPASSMAPRWDTTPDPRCAICNARPGQPHLATGRYA